MKNSLLVILLLFSISSFAQTLYVPGGSASGIGNNTVNTNIGIGITTPSGLLHLKTPSGGNFWSSYNYGANLVIDGPHHNAIALLDAGSSNPFAIANVSGKLTISKMPSLGDMSTAPSELFTINNSGNVGIGITTASGLLHLKTSSSGNFWSSSNYGANLVIDGPHHNAIALLDAGSSNPFAIANVSGILTISKMPSLGDVSTGPSELFTINNSGNVGIGTNSPGSFKLAVEGKIGAREVNVTAANPWPDYVLEKDYKLKPLEEVSQYIKENKHLPEIPSAKEVKENGQNLGEMNALLLKKIEELTLYVIDQNKRLSNLEKENDELKSLIKK